MVLKLTHANTKRDIFVASPLVFACYYSDASKCTHVLASGGAIIPVTETPEIVMNQVEAFIKGEHEIQRSSKKSKRLSKDKTV